MSKDPAVLFYTSDFLSGISFLSMEQRGQYITLLCQQHQLDVIPENHMISICGSLDSPVVDKFIKDDKGNYYNKRMREEAIKRRSFCDSRSNNKSGRPKKENHTKIIRKSYENHMEDENENEDLIDNNSDKNINISINKSRFSPPSLDDIKQYIKENSYNVVPDVFFYFYESKCWMVGKNKMKNWKAAVAQWHVRNKTEKKEFDHDTERNIIRKVPSSW